MRKLKRSECAVLHLVMKKKWFDLIASREKKEEYRGDTPYWDVRLIRWADKAKGTDAEEGKTCVVAFSCGYRKPTMWFQLTFLTFGTTSKNPDWGEPQGPHYVIVLGERVELED